MPSRTSDVHDSKVRRIAAITSDMVRPNRTTPRPALHRSRIESQYPLRQEAGKSPNRERKLHCKKMRGVNACGWIFRKIEAPSASRRSKTAAGPIRRRQPLNGCEFRPRHRRDHHLRDSLAATDREGRVAVIDQQHADLAAVIRVYRAWRVQHGDAVLGGQTRARADLRLESLRQCDDKAGRNQRMFAWSEHD